MDHPNPTPNPKPPLTVSNTSAGHEQVMMGLFITWIILMVMAMGVKLSVRSQAQAMTWNGVSRATDVNG